MRVAWKQLGHPTSPGTVTVGGIGLVDVTEQDIQTAAKYGGRVVFELHDVTDLGEDTHHYCLGTATPL